MRNANAHKIITIANELNSPKLNALTHFCNAVCFWESCVCTHTTIHLYINRSGGSFFREGVHVKCNISNYLTWKSTSTGPPLAMLIQMMLDVGWYSFTNFENHKLNASIIFESMFDQFNDLNELYAIQNWTKLLGVSWKAWTATPPVTGPSEKNSIYIYPAHILYQHQSSKRRNFCDEFFMLSIW